MIVYRVGEVVRDKDDAKKKRYLIFKVYGNQIRATSAVRHWQARHPEREFFIHPHTVRSVAEALGLARDVEELHSMYSEALRTYEGATDATKRKWHQVVSRRELTLNTKPLLGPDGKPLREEL